MRKVLVRPSMVWVVFLFLILQLSCVHKGPSPPSAEVRENFGTIGVASGCFKPECSLQKRTSELASEALKGAWDAEGKLNQVTMAPAELGTICCVVLTPFALCGGALSGAAKARPVEKLDAESETALRNAFQQVNLQELMRDRILRIAREKTNYTFVNLVEQGPSTPDEGFDYSAVANQGIHTVLEIAVLEVGLVGNAEIYPNLQFFMSARTRLILAVDGEEVYVETLAYKGAMHTYSVWAADNAQSFGEELRGGSEELSERIVELLFALAWSGKVLSVQDGDTITVQRDGEQVRIGLYGIDCPEGGQAFGKKAKQFTSDMVLGKVVKVAPVVVDERGRTVALVTTSEHLVNEEVVNAGLAWVYTRYCDKPICERWKVLEQEARGAKRGLWSDPNPIPPWEFRRQ